MIKTISEKNITQDIISHEGIIAVIIYSKYSGAYYLMKSRYIKIYKRYNKEFSFYKLEFEKAQNINTKYKINISPSILIFNNGKLKNKIEGLFSEYELEKQFILSIKDLDENIGGNYGKSSE